MPIRKSTLKRHDLLRSRLWELQKENYKNGVRDYVWQACKQLAKETGYSPRTLWDIYFKDER